MCKRQTDILTYVSGGATTAAIAPGPVGGENKMAAQADRHRAVCHLLQPATSQLLVAGSVGACQLHTSRALYFHIKN